MARMLGRAHRPLTCGYGCCVSDWTPRRKSLVRRRARAIEGRVWRKDVRRLLAGPAQ